MKNEKPEQWIIEWSERYSVFHVHTVDEMLTKNRNAYLYRYGLDWQPVGIARDWEQAAAFIEHLETLRRQHTDAAVRERLTKIYHGPRRRKRKPVA